MTILLVSVLAASLTNSSSCAQLLTNIEHSLSSWKASARIVGPDFEEHTYRSASARGVTTKISVVAAFGPEIGLREIRGYEQMDRCEMGGLGARILIKIERK